MKLKHAILVLFCCLTFGAMAQKTVLKEFQQAQLPQQMLEYLNQATSEKEKIKANEQLINAFDRVYKAMDQTTQGRVLNISNVVLKLKVRQLPDVYNYIATLTAYYNLNTSNENFNQWLSCIEFLQSRNKKIKDFTDFVEFSDNLLKDRTLNKSRSCMWQTQDGIPFQLKLRGQDIVVVFDKPFELYYSSDQDNGTIYGTTGVYYYLDTKWVGKGGRINWDRTGIPNQQCWGVLNGYEANTKFPKFVADSVLFTNTKYFNTPIYGRVEEALSGKMEAEKYTFPKFRSYQRDFQLKDILPGVDYSGSFMMNGSKFITSDTKNPATLIFYRDGKRFITVKSVKFTITYNKILSDNASVKIYIGDDSIWNNGITVRYLTTDRQVTLLNSTKRNYYSPYGNSYHNLDMYCESIVWKQDKDILEMSMLGQSGDQTFSTFESNSYFSEAKFRAIQGIDELNPVVRVYRYIKAQGIMDEFYIDEFARAVHLDIQQAKLMIHNLSGSGLVNYDESLGKVYVNKKLLDYNLAASKNKVLPYDYDAITLESNAKGSNAQLDLSTNDILMHGVKKFNVSDSQQVVIYPLNGELVVHKNRDMDFSGRINAGRFVAYVTDAKFLYKEFRLDLPKVDSMVFYVTKFNNPDEEHIVYTPLYNLVGNIQIDKPDNHSGLKEAKEYPIFSSKEDCYVYYDRKDIYGGTYDRNRFYYTIHPFVVRDMDGFKTDSLEFNGVLNSGGIFPDIKEPLKVQRDYSLGFVMETPRSGFPTYGGKGQYKETIDLSYRGLRGQGQLNYLSATIVSKEFVFMPDSAIGVSDTFFVKEDATFPQISNSRCRQHWFPYQDSMRVVQLQKGPEFRMFRGDGLLAGYLTLRPQGANASGAITINEGTIESRHFNLHPRVMDAQVSTFTLRSDVYRNIAFYATNMKSHTDYDKKRAEFTSNDPLGRTDLPLLSYNAYVDKFSWQWDKKELDLINSKSESTGGLEGLSLRERFAHTEQPGARFVSTDPKRDSLQFYAVRSHYLYNAGQLSCQKVFTVRSADAVIAPGGDSLHIGAGGIISPLSKSQILCSTSNKYHLIYNANVVIEGAQKYSGNGTVDYLDEKDKKQKIFLSEIAPDAKGMTVGKGFIPDSANFTLNEAFGFAGQVRLDADSANYYFDGGVRLIHNCAPADQLGLLAYKGYVDPRAIFIYVPELPTDWKGNRITASVLFDPATIKPRAAFLTNERAADNELMHAHGFLTYSSDSSTYTIASAAKLKDPDAVVEPFLALNTRTCQLTGEGPLNFNVKQNHVKLFCYGTASVNNNRIDESEFNSILGFTFPIDDKVLNTMQQLISDDLRLSPSQPDNDIVRRAMMHYQGAAEGEANYNNYVSTGYYDKMPKDFESTLLLEGIDWKYSPVLGYYYNGVAGLSAIGKKQLHLATRVKAQFYKKGNGTYLTIYIQVASDHWYYFNYEFNSQQMIIYSSVGEWVDMIKSIPPEKRVTEGKNGQGDYRYRIGSSRVEVPNFLIRLDGGKATDIQEDMDGDWETQEADDDED